MTKTKNELVRYIVDLQTIINTLFATSDAEVAKRQSFIDERDRALDKLHKEILKG